MMLRYSDYVQTYASMADEGLLQLSKESASLLDTAREALQGELERRGLKSQAANPGKPTADEALYCSHCEREATDPLTCGSCFAFICRVCGTPLEVIWEAGDSTGDEDLEERITAREQVAGS
jgi:hypothetical protein